MKKAIVLTCFLAVAAFGFAQAPIDSLLKKANFELYENPSSAIAIGKKILSDKNARDQDKIDALLVISTGYSSQRNYPKSLEYAVQASQLLPKINDDKFKIIVYSRLGVQYQQLKIYDKAHSYLDKAIKVAQDTKQQFNAHKLLGFNYAIRGMVYKEQMSCDIAQNYFNKSLYHYGKSTKESINNANLSVIVYNKGNCFLSLNEIDSARICFKTSYRYADTIKANSLKSFANKGLAEVNTLTGDYKTAISLLLDAEKMSKNVGDLVLNQGIYKGLSDNYLVSNSIERHNFYRKKYDQTTALIKNNNAKTINQLIGQLKADSDIEIAAIKSGALWYKLIFATVIFALLLAIYFEHAKDRKKYKSLKLRREAFEKAPVQNNKP